jgi:2-dehydro-3-deoxyglucarate aldolase
VTDFGSRFSEYFQAHNDEVVVVVVLEHITAVQNADAILATPGLDAVLIGPYESGIRKDRPPCNSTASP